MSEIAQIGDGVAKPWDRETCRRRYVEGTAIGLRPLARLSGVTFASLTNWSSCDKLDPEMRPWPVQRQQYQDALRTTTQQKSIELISDRYAEQNLAVLKEHIQLAENQRNLAGVFVKALNTQINAIRSRSKKMSEQEKKAQQASLEAANDLIKVFKNAGGKNPWATATAALHQGVTIERLSLYMDLFVDPTVLEKAAARQGLSLVDLEANQDDD